jgi:hypothetical protein
VTDAGAAALRCQLVTARRNSFHERLKNSAAFHLDIFTSHDKV